MYKSFGAATPRSAGRRSVALFVGRSRAPSPLILGAGFGAGLATLLACDNPTRPTFPGGSANDSLPPQIQIALPLPSDTVFSSGSSVPVRVEAHDPSGVTIDCEVTGAVGFAVPPQMAPDTLLGLAFAIPVAAGKTGKVLLTANATDGLGNKSTKTFAFVVK